MEVEVKVKKKDGTEEKYKYGAQDKYDKSNTTQVKLKLNNRTDADIIEYLNNQNSKQGKIKELIREAIKNEKDIERHPEDVI